MIDKNHYFCFNQKCEQVNIKHDISELLYKVKVYASSAKVISAAEELGTDMLSIDSIEDDVSTSAKNEYEYISFSLKSFIENGYRGYDNGYDFSLARASSITLETPSFWIRIKKEDVVDIEKEITLADRVCPYCEEMIPECFGNSNIYVGMLFGASSAGKSTILAGMALSALNGGGATVNGYNVIVGTDRENEYNLTRGLLKKSTGANQLKDDWKERVLFIYLDPVDSVRSCNDVLMLCDASGEFSKSVRDDAAEQNSRGFDSLTAISDAIIIVRDSCSLNNIVSCYKNQTSEMQEEIRNKVVKMTDDAARKFRDEISKYVDLENKQVDERGEPIKRNETVAQLRRRFDNCKENVPQIIYVLNKIDVLEMLLSLKNDAEQYIFDDAMRHDGEHFIDVGKSRVFKSVHHDDYFDMFKYCEKALELSELLSNMDIEDYGAIRHIIKARGSNPARGLFAISATDDNRSVLEPLAWLIETLIKKNGGNFRCTIEEQFCRQDNAKPRRR